MSENSPAGFLNVNKPRHWTSHDVVAQVRRHYRKLTGSKKVGHAGTLDPLAEGVLVICLGAATRLSDYVMRSRKVYQGQITFGATTTTYDAEGEIVTTKNADHIMLSDIERVLPQFIGDIEQVPPMYSAIKVGGKKLYELARQGQSVERQPRKVTVHSINVRSWNSPILEIEIECGSGTYIRSLAHDLGEELGVGAHLSGLTRTSSGMFKYSDSITLETLSEDDDWTRHIISPYDALSNQPQVTLTGEEIERIRHGGFIQRPPETDADTIFAFDADRRLIAILQPRDELWKPHKVFPSQN